MYVLLGFILGFHSLLENRMIYHNAAQRYDFRLSMAKTIFYERVQQLSKIMFPIYGTKCHIFKPAFYFFYYYILTQTDCLHIQPCEKQKAPSTYTENMPFET